VELQDQGWEPLRELDFSYNIIKSTRSTALVEEPAIKLPLMNELCEYYEKHNEEHKALIMTA